MFSREDFHAYFEDIEAAFTKHIVLLTDILNEVSDNAVRNKLYAIAQDDIAVFENARAQKERFQD